MSIISMNASNVNYEQYKKNLLMAAITSILIMGTSIIPMQSYANQHKKTTDFKDSIKAGTEVDKKSASQNLDQDNFCYRSDGCQQANQGQQIVGKDNDANGFNDQSINVPQSAPSVTAPPAPPAPPAPLTCEQCFTKFFTSEQISKILIDTNQVSLAGECAAGASEGIISESLIRNYLKEQFALSDEIINNFIKCVKDSGLVFGP
jgi:hypothetical protein